MTSKPRTALAAAILRSGKREERVMSILKIEAERARAGSDLVKQYRPIGPAAIAAIAAAVAAMEKRKPKTVHCNEASSLKHPASSVPRRAKRH